MIYRTHPFKQPFVWKVGFMNLTFSSEKSAPWTWLFVCKVALWTWLFRLKSRLHESDFFLGKVGLINLTYSSEIRPHEPDFSVWISRFMNLTLSCEKSTYSNEPEFFIWKIGLAACSISRPLWRTSSLYGNPSLMWSSCSLENYQRKSLS